MTLLKFEASKKKEYEEEKMALLLDLNESYLDEWRDEWDCEQQSLEEENALEEEAKSREIVRLLNASGDENMHRPIPLSRLQLGEYLKGRDAKDKREKKKAKLHHSVDGDRKPAGV